MRLRLKNQAAAGRVRRAHRRHEPMGARQAVAPKRSL